MNIKNTIGPKFNIDDKIKDGNEYYTITQVSKGSWFFDTPPVYGILAEDGTEWACEEKMLKNATKI